MTIERKLQNIVDSKEQIKSAIENKGVTVGSAPLSQYADKIEEIQSKPDYALIWLDDNNIELHTKDGVIKKNTFFSYYEYYNDPLPNIFLPSNIVEIKNNAFRKAVIKNLNMRKISKIGTNTFNYCIFEESLIIPSNLKVVNGASFIDCSADSLVIEDGVEELENFAFDGFKLNSGSNFDLVLPESVKFIGYSTFGSAAINSIVTGATNRLELLEESFRSNSNLKSAVIKNVKQLSGAFSSCQYLANIELGSPGNPVLGPISTSTFRSCKRLTEIKIYVSNQSSPGLTGAPWGATNATITYLQA